MKSALKDRVRRPSGNKPGCQFMNKKFTVFGNPTDGKKCFKDDCKNEGETCNTCCMIQGEFIYYQPKGANENQDS